MAKKTERDIHAPTEFINLRYYHSTGLLNTGFIVNAPISARSTSPLFEMSIVPTVTTTPNTTFFSYISVIVPTGTASIHTSAGISYRKLTLLIAASGVLALSPRASLILASRHLALYQSSVVKLLAS